MIKQYLYSYYRTTKQQNKKLVFLFPKILQNKKGKNEINSFRVSPSSFCAPALDEVDHIAKIVVLEVA